MSAQTTPRPIRWDGAAVVKLYPGGVTYTRLPSGRYERVPLREGDIFLMQPHMLHSPQRPEPARQHRRALAPGTDAALAGPVLGGGRSRGGAAEMIPGYELGSSAEIANAQSGS